MQSSLNIENVSLEHQIPAISEGICASNPWYWAYTKAIQLIPGPFRLNGHEFQVRPMSIRPKVKVFRKATQMVVTESEVLNVLNGMIYGYYPVGVYYLFPSKDKVSEFSKSRFKPLIQDNPATIGQFVRDTDSVNLKRIGSGFLYFRSGRLHQEIEGIMKTSAALKGDPADHAVHDEYDEMDPDIDEYIEGRLAKSSIHTKSYLANPTIPDYGIDRKFQTSSQEYWHVKCPACGAWTCFDWEDNFPRLFYDFRDGTVIRACSHCERALDVRFGRWIPANPDEKDIMGFTIGHPSAYWIDPKDLLQRYRDPQTQKANFIRLELGRAHVEADEVLTPPQVYACCGNYGMHYSSEIENAYGLDVGKDLHMVIGHPTSLKTRKILKVARISSFNDVHDLAQKFHCACGVIDMEPETRTVRRFQATEPYKIFLCDYAERQRVSQRLDESKEVMVVRRTELFDQTHELFRDGLIEIPRKSQEIERYAKELCNAVKILKEDKETGYKSYHYIKRGREDYRNATNYFELACQYVRIPSTSALIKQHNVKTLNVLKRIKGEKEKPNVLQNIRR